MTHQLYARTGWPWPPLALERPADSAWVLNAFNADARKPMLAPGSLPKDVPMPRRPT